MANTNPGGAIYDNRVRYTGGYLDTDTGLYKLGICNHEPAAGRFTQPDPTGQNPGYIYPVNRTEPSGSEFLYFDISLGDAAVCLRTSQAMRVQGKEVGV